MYLFQQLVGQTSLDHVVLATTHWNKNDRMQPARHDELITTYWKRMAVQGSRIKRHNGSWKSAVAIVKPLISAPPTVVSVVDELVEQDFPWNKTGVGLKLNEELNKEIAIKDEEIAEEKRISAEIKERADRSNN
jgi:hypothetical protein